MNHKHTSLYAALVTSVLFIVSAQRAAAQTCEDDGGSVCELDDGGFLDEDDAGPGGGHSADAGFADPDGGFGSDAQECSCNASIDNEQGDIHVCTESTQSDACVSFTCQRGDLRQRRCSSEARLCCEMNGRGLRTYLYDDCTHPNCESGFRSQCEDFAGEVYEGECPSAQGLQPGESDDGFCSVSRPGMGRHAASVWTTWLLGLGLAFAVRATRRRSQRG